MRAWITGIIVGSVLAAAVAGAEDSNIARLHGADAQVVAAWGKANLDTTNKVRLHFAAKKNAEIEAWAKKAKVDAAATKMMLRMADVLAVKGIGPRLAWILVAPCKVNGLIGLKTGIAAELRQCIEAHNATAKLLETVPTVDEVTVWIKDAATAGADVRVGSWANIVAIGAYAKANAPVRNALKKAKLLNNVEIFGALALAAQREAFAKKYKLDLVEVARYFFVSDLMRLQGITPGLAEVLYQAGYKGLSMVKSATPAELVSKIAATDAALKLYNTEVTPEQAQVWIEAAKPFPSR